MEYDGSYWPGQNNFDSLIDGSIGLVLVSLMFTELPDWTRGGGESQKPG